MTEICRGYCPELDKDNHRIEVRYKLQGYLGTSNVTRVFLSGLCKNSPNCAYLAQHGFCPLIKEISVTFH